MIVVAKVGGLTAFPGWGLYCAAKYALEGLTESLAESLAAKVAEFGVKVNLVEPGYLRTDFLIEHSLGLPATADGAYPAVREMTRAHQAMPGTQLGDPARAAAAIIAVATAGPVPLHQLLGTDSLGFARSRVDTLQADIEASHALAVTTDIGASSSTG